MGTPLTGLTVAATYGGLLKTTDNLALSGALRVITDGLGNDSALQVSTAGVSSTGTFAVTGAAALASTLGVTGVTSLAAGAVGAPGLYLAADTTTGLYRIGANNLGLAISGTKLLDLSAASVGITGALAVSTTFAAIGTIVGGSSISDSTGNVRSLVQNAQSGAYTAALTDNGKHIKQSSAAAITVNASGWTAGMVFHVVNLSGSSIGLTQGTASLVQAGTGTTGSRTLAAYGSATFLCTSNDTFLVSGVGLT